MWGNQNFGKKTLPILVFVLLVGAFALWRGGIFPPAASEPSQEVSVSGAAVSSEDTVSEAASPSSDGANREGGTENSVQSGNPNQEKEKVLQAPAATEQPKADAAQNTGTKQASSKAPGAPAQAAASGAKEYSCTISISCATLQNNLDRLSEAKHSLVPADGWILKPTQMTGYEGESVFNLLQRACKQGKIHMEYENTPIYQSAYIEGIGNLYEFDAGDLSGWMYQVNGWFPNYGCSRYQPQDGDVINWVYTCDLGEDVGGGKTLKDQRS